MVVSQKIRNFADKRSILFMATAIKAIPTLYGEDAIRFKKKVDEAVTMHYIQFYGCVYCFGILLKKYKNGVKSINILEKPWLV